MFIFGNENQLTDYIIQYKGDFEELKNKKIIGGKVWYGSYFNKEYKKMSRKQSDLVMSDEKAIYFIEIKCEYITPEIVELSRQAISRKDFYKRVEVIFIGTKISNNVKQDIDSYSRFRYILIKNVQHVEGYKPVTDIKKYGYFKNVELYAYEILNYGFNIRSDDIKKYVINRIGTELKLECRFLNGYGINIVMYYDKNLEDFILEYEIVKIHKGYTDILANIYHNTYYRVSKTDLGNVYHIVRSSDKNFLNKENIGDILKAIRYLKSQWKRR